jgi:glycerol-3-phosphate dehydrogenase
MKREPERLSDTRFDLAVIGGGVNGAAIAREAALAGMKVALVEARDFAAGTSSRSSKLIHGGLRYLKQYKFKLVREARRERRLLARLAPHLVKPIPFLLPIYPGDPDSPLMIRLGLTLYDLFGGLGKNDRHRMLSPADAVRRVPRLKREGLRKAAVYFDSLTDDARLTLEYALDAAARGAVVANYTEIRAFDVSSGGARQPTGSEVVRAEAVDTLTGKAHEISARFWVNATGPWVDHLRALVPGYDGSKTVRLTKGTHIILPPLSGPYAVFAPILPCDLPAEAGRVFVMMPWHGCSLLGTTDTDYDGDPAAVRPEPEDTEYLLAAVNRVLARPVEAGEVVGAFAGLRALAVEPGLRAGRSPSPSENTREYRFHQDPWAGNFISVCGGKITTARSLGENLVARLATRLGIARRGLSSRREILPGGQTGVFEVYVDYASWEALRMFKVPIEIAERIVRTYGGRWREILEPVRDDASLAEALPGEPSLLAAEVEFAIRSEMAVCVEDFLLRRSGLSWLARWKLRDAAPRVAEIFASRLGWSAEHRQEQSDAFARSTD